MSVYDNPVIAEGKTKRLHLLGQGVCLVVHKDDITAGNGARHAMMGGKAVFACRTTSNVFRLLIRAGIPNHFIEAGQGRYLEPNEMLVTPCTTIKIEVVARRVTTGSYLKRNPEVVEGTVFPELVTEFFLKNDDRDDPFLEYDSLTGRWLYWDAALPRVGQEGQVLEPEFDLLKGTPGSRINEEQQRRMRSLLIRVFETLETAWQTLGVQLIDLKIEFGITQHGQLVVADVIDNDSWRIWPAGDKRLQLDKQSFRELATITDVEMERIRGNYERVADLTDSWVVALPPQPKGMHG